jgi:phosphate starvation-inducible PhoH-like protein
MRTLTQTVICGKRHESYKHALENVKIPLVIATGPAGTGKTRMPCILGVKHISENSFEKMIITRPTIAVGGENIGFLPGDVNEKIAPWISHMMDYVNVYDFRCVSSNIDTIPLAYIRGATWDNTWVIADEMQNSTKMQMKTLLTRVGNNTKLVITGDLSQSDLDPENNGLYDLIAKTKSEPLCGNDDMMRHIEFLDEDVKRSEFVKYIIQAYKE